MSNKITFGLRNVHYSPANYVNNEWVFSIPKKLQGAQEITIEVIGGSQNVYADDVVIASPASISGANVTLRFTNVCDEFKKDILGYVLDSVGNLIEVTDSEIKTFALGYEIQGDSKARRVWYFLCSASPIGDGSKSKTDSVEANSIELKITARPIEVSGRLVLRRIASIGDSNYPTFLTVIPTVPLIGS